jgi:TldD protein
MYRIRSALSAFAVAILLVPVFPARAAAPAGSLGSILQAELQRNFQILSHEPVPAYFIAYTVHDVRNTTISAAYGALLRSDQSRARFGMVDLRAGDYALDNTHPLRAGATPTAAQYSRLPLPLENSEALIRTGFWRATDRAFRQSVQSMARVQSGLASMVKEENPAPDFSREEPRQYAAPVQVAAVDRAAWERRLRRASAVFAADPQVLRSDVQLDVESDLRYYTSSEGANIATVAHLWRLSVRAVTKAADGMELPLNVVHYGRTEDAMPSEADLVREAREVQAQLAQLRSAPVVDPATVPAILSGRAAGVFFHEIFGHRVEGHRQRDISDAQTFAKRVDKAVLPPFVSVVFDPTREKLGNIPLNGYYQFDDEGVPARPVTVVDKGILKTFLLGRAPLAAFPRSNGHGRAQPGRRPVSRQSNLLVQSDQQVTPAKLLDMLRDEIRKQGKPFGLYFESIEGGFTQTGRTAPNAFNVLPTVVYRVYADGRPNELVRGVDLIGTPLAAFGRIVATDNRVEVFNGICGAESGNVPVSAASPALLVSEVEVQKKSQSQESRPILAAPLPGGSR